MKTIKEQYTEAITAFNTVLNEVNPLASGYYDFIRSGQIGHYTDDSVPAGNELSFDEFHPTPADPEKGIRYEGQYQDYGDTYNYHFTVPYEYLADPEIWKQETLAKFHGIEATIEKIFLRIYPEKTSSIKKGETRIHIRFDDWTEGDDLIIIDIKLRGFPNFYHKGQLQSNHFFVKLSTEELYHVDYPYSDRHGVEDGTIKPLKEQKND